MTTVFIAGSIKIKHLDEAFVERIETIVSEDFSVVVGDANGADTAIQSALLEKKAQNVEVYCSGSRARNNVGNWVVKKISSAAPEGTREFFAAKDRAMAKDADYGLFMWDLASTGTLSNIFELFYAGKKSVVYIKKNRRFLNVKTEDDISKLVSFMSDKAKDQAERKIGLKSKLSTARHPQLGLQF